MLHLLRELWSRVQDELRSRAGASAYDSWLATLKPLALERSICYFEAHNRLACERVKRLFVPLLEDCLSREVGTRIAVHVQPAPESLVPDQLEVGPTQPVVDASNRSAWQVLRALLTGKELPTKLFFFYGPAGCGKTFLLQWWAALAPARPRVFAGRGLVHMLQAALRDQRLAELRAELAADQILVLDEVHRLSGHARLQYELVQLLKERERTAAPVLIASRWHPRDIWGIEPSFESWLLSGFVCELQQPGPSARLQYLRALEGTASRNGRAEPIEQLARDVRGSWSDLRHAWAAQRRGLPVTKSHLQLIEPRGTFERLCARVGQRLQISLEELLAEGQGRRVSFARQVLAYLCVQEGLTRAEVGRYLGGRSRASISYAIKALEERMAQSETVRRQVEELL